MTVVNPLNPLELLAGELAYACNNGMCPCVSKENCPFDSQDNICSKIYYFQTGFSGQKIFQTIYMQKQNMQEVNNHVC